VIDHCFNLTEAEAIKSIPLSSTSQLDKLIWPFTPTSQYSVKSGYRFLFESNSPQPLSNPSSTQSMGWWKKLWKMEVPNKVKHFVWRTCREALPTKANLSRRRIIPDGVCDRCETHRDDSSHALFFCFDVQVVWTSDPNWQWLLDMQGQTAKKIFVRALEEDKDATLLAFTSWAIWNRRNKPRVGQAACPLNQI